jgi:hypothetical protein
MAFTVNDFRDLVRLLAEHPEWRAELRPLILNEEILRMPVALAAIAETQERTEARLEELVKAQQRTEARLEELAGDVSQLTRSVQDLTAQLAKAVTRLDRLDGFHTEQLFLSRARGYFGVWLRRPRIVGADDLGLEDALEAGKLSAIEMEEVDLADILLRGGDKQTAGSPDTVVVVEVSSTIDTEDIRRAVDRATIVAKLGFRARGGVAGLAISDRAASMASEKGVLVRVIPQGALPA